MHTLREAFGLHLECYAVAWAREKEHNNWDVIATYVNSLLPNGLAPKTIIKKVLVIRKTPEGAGISFCEARI
jgi:hypothetical protein